MKNADTQILVAAGLGLLAIVWFWTSQAKSSSGGGSAASSSGPLMLPTSSLLPAPPYDPTVVSDQSGASFADLSQPGN
jgi:hypothetical protein